MDQPNNMPPISPTVHEAHFKKVQRFHTEYAPSCLTQYESTRTGMRVAVVDQEGPIVHGSFIVATEIHDDSGAPHTLEHLCFMGSKSYPYKGVLDRLANRAYSDTNAWTATDYTEYTLDSAGWEGFSQILPVYLEHIIAPTLTDAACYTEVHHVDGTGSDAGVVYSEMQGKENAPEMLIFLKQKRLLYPEGVGFRYETFGVMESLRELTADRIREYHSEMYQPKNVCLIIIGMVDHAHLLDILDNFEETILEDIIRPDRLFRRPWMDSKQAPFLENSITESVEFPEDDESSGEISISFFGPANSDKLLCRALTALLTYLAGSPASVLDNTLVEREQLASAVYYDIEGRPTTVISFTLTSVATNDLEKVKARFLELLRETAAEKLDMGYMLDCVKREKRQVKFYAESSGQFFTEPILNDHLFGKRDGSDLRANLETLNDYDILETWDDCQWRHCLKNWMSEAHSVTVLARPSVNLSETIRANERSRIEARKKNLGVIGLENLKERLTSAKAENDIEAPRTLLQRFEVPSTDSIKFINTATARSGAARSMGVLNNHIQPLINQDSEVPLFVHFEHIESNFVYLSLILGTEAIPIPLRPLLAIYMDNFFCTPMKKGEQVLGFEQVIKHLEQDSVEYSIELGRAIGNSEVITIKLHAEVEKYQIAIRWLKDLMWSSFFDIERIKATTAKLLADIPDEKRDGGHMVGAVELMVGSAPSSTGRACSTLVKALYLKRVKQLLETNPQVVLKQLSEVNFALCQPCNFRVLVAADVERLQRPVSSWKALIEGHDAVTPLRPLDTRLSRLSEQGRNPGNTAYIIPMPPVDSSFAVVVGKGPSSLNDPAVPALMVAVSYLNAVEGLLWNAVRGTGLAYGTNFHRYIDSGQVSLHISNSPNIVKAFLASRDVVTELASDRSVLDTFALEGAISSIVLDLAAAEANKVSAAQASFVRQVIRGLPKDWPTIILARIRKVQPEDIKKVLTEFFVPLFERNTANLFLTCAPDMEEGLVKGFGELGFLPEVKPVAFFQDDYGLLGGEETDELEEEEEEMESDESEGDDDNEVSDELSS